MLPSVFSERLFGDVFGDPFPMMPAMHGHGSIFGRHGRNLMKADVRELENSYELDVDLPGFKKDQVDVELEDGYMTICAAKGEGHEEEKRGQYIRRERCVGECCRTFYVGKGLEPKDICAKFEDGILRISFPKAPSEKEPECRKVTVQ